MPNNTLTENLVVLKTLKLLKDHPLIYAESRILTDKELSDFDFISHGCGILISSEKEAAEELLGKHRHLKDLWDHPEKWDACGDLYGIADPDQHITDIKEQAYNHKRMATRYYTARQNALKSILNHFKLKPAARTGRGSR